MRGPYVAPGSAVPSAAEHPRGVELRDRSRRSSPAPLGLVPGGPSTMAPAPAGGTVAAVVPAARKAAPRAPRSARAIKSARCWSRPPAGARAERALPAHRSRRRIPARRRAPARTPPRSRGRETRGCARRPRRRGSCAGERRSQIASCSMKVGRIAGLERLPPPASRLAATHTRAPAPGRPAQVVGNRRWPDPLETARTPPTGTSTATSARARETPAA